MNEDVETLEGIILDADAMYYKRRDALTKLARQDPAAARPLLMQILTDPEKVLRREAALLLASHPDPAVHASLEKALADGDSDVRRNAARALKESGGASALETLKRLAEKDDSIFVRREAEEAVKALGSASKQGAPVSPPTPAPPRRGEPQKKEESSTALPSSRPPWKKDEEEEIRPSLEHFKAARKEPEPARIPARKERKEEPSRPPPSRDHMPPWKGEASHGRARASSLAASMLPKKPSSPVERPKAIRKKILPVAHIERAPRSKRRRSPPPPPPSPVPTEQISRKVRKIVATQAKGAQLCPKCQWVVKPGQRFCTFCGTPMSPASARPAPASPAAASQETRRPVRRSPRPPSMHGNQPAPAFLKAGCIGAAVLGFIFVFFVFICLSGSSPSVPEPATPPARVTKRAPAPPRRTARPGLEGRRVLIILRNGQQIQGNLLSKTDDSIRVKSGNVTRQIPKAYVKQIHYR